MAFLPRGRGTGKPRQRFSLLLLEPGEIYFNDFSVIFLPDAEGNDADSAFNSYAAGGHAARAREGVAHACL